MMREEGESRAASSVLLVALATSLALAGCKSDADKSAVLSADKTGWVNRKYIAHATGISTSQFAQHYAKRAGGHPAKTPWELVNRIVQDMNTPPQEEGHYQAELVDMQVAGSIATSTVYACCELDDSVQGEQALLTLVHANDGWRLSRADVRWLCYRGVSDDGLCI